MMMVSASLSPLLAIFFGVPAGIGVAIVVCECGAMLKHRHSDGAKPPH